MQFSQKNVVILFVFYKRKSKISVFLKIYQISFSFFPQEVQEFCIRSTRTMHKKSDILAQKSRLSPKDRRCFFVFRCFRASKTLSPF